MHVYEKKVLAKSLQNKQCECVCVSLQYLRVPSNISNAYAWEYEWVKFHNNCQEESIQVLVLLPSLRYRYHGALVSELDSFISSDISACVLN